MIFITVHGTGDETPGQSEKKWWETDSEFAQMLLAASGGGDEIVPFIWSGENSELDRRAGGEQLLKMMRDLERRGERYVLIGHSHGGSVIRSALRAAAYRNRRLEGLVRWITVGTPFIELRPKRFFFSRLSITGQAMVMAILAALVVYASTISTVLSSGASVSVLEVIIAASMVALFLIAPSIYLLRRSQRRVAGIYARTTDQRIESEFLPKWTSLWDRADEAINGLIASQSASSPVTPKDVATGPIKSIGVLFFLISGLGPLFKSLLRPVFHSAESFEAFFGSAFFAAHQPFAYVSTRIDQLNNIAIEAFYFQESTLIYWPILAGLNVLTFLGWGAIIIVSFFLIQAVAQLISRPFALLADGFFWGLLRTKAVGNDTAGELNEGVSAEPTNGAPQWRPFPDELSKSLHDYTTEHAADALARAQNVLGLAREMSNGVDLVRSLAQQFKWDELIHTSYFKAPLSQAFIVFATLKTSNLPIAAPLPGAADPEKLDDFLSQIEPPVGREPPQRSSFATKLLRTFGFR